MKFFRLEKPNYFAKWSCAIIKALAWAFIVIVAFMLIMGYKFMIVSSGSMEPTLPVGSLVIVTPCKYEDLNVGDIVTMNINGINLTHRIVGKVANLGDNPNDDINLLLTNPEDDAFKEAEYWITKGDNSDTIDPASNAMSAIGKVYEGHCFAWVGLLVRYIRANYKMVIAMVVIIVAFVFILEWIKDKMVEDDIECYETEDEEE